MAPGIYLSQKFICNIWTQPGDTFSSFLSFLRKWMSKSINELALFVSNEKTLGRFHQTLANGVWRSAKIRRFGRNSPVAKFSFFPISRTYYMMANLRGAYFRGEKNLLKFTLFFCQRIEKYNFDSVIASWNYCDKLITCWRSLKSFEDYTIYMTLAFANLYTS